ncbi:phage major capsid protein [Sphingomonas histidinilytica]|uniref:phage major capsid protein n=1 Tax=Rhizorhabdus histidinilytica TaxID=439228 RepID=UPI001ADA9AED|nr:phage major capsid protein [Rhizorhabdus histidinilytica]MBO9377907.1 phage major capsid protein [Rhizorhabdus histidinilytica]
MPTLRELQEQREKLVAGARERLDQINASTDESRTKELETQHDAAMSELDALDAKIEREERVARAERNLEERREREARGQRPLHEPVNDAQGAGNGDVTYRDAFHAYIRAEGNLGMLDAETRSVLQRGYQKIEQGEQRAQTTTNAAGGYTVPTELQAEIFKTMKMWGPMYDPGVTREIVTSGGYSMPFPTVDDTANTFGATTQGVTLTDDGSGDVTFGQKSLGAWSFATPWIRVSKELADDSLFAMESLIGDLAGERLGRGANGKLTVGAGSGSSEANGVVTASTAGKTAASATAFTSDEILDLEHSVDPAYRGSPKAAFMFHDLVLAAIRKLKDGQGNYLWTAGNVQQGVPAQINGRRYHINQAMASAFTTGQKLILWGDFNKYIVRKVGTPLIGAIQDKDFWPGFGIAGWIRFDGNLMDTAAIKHLKLA